MTFSNLNCLDFLNIFMVGTYLIDGDLKLLQRGDFTDSDVKLAYQIGLPSEMNSEPDAAQPNHVSSKTATSLLCNLAKHSYTDIYR